MRRAAQGGAAQGGTAGAKPDGAARPRDRAGQTPPPAAIIRRAAAPAYMPPLSRYSSAMRTARRALSA